MFRKFFHLSILVFTLTTTLLYAQVVINELMIEPNNPDFGEIFSEYIELANYGEEAVDLEAWSVETNAGSEAIGSNLVIEPGGFILLGISDNTTLTLGVEMDYAWGIGSDIDLNNTSDDIRLIDSGGNIADEVSYDSGWTLTSGASLEKLNPALDGSNSINWNSAIESYDSQGNLGSPGADNTVLMDVPDIEYASDSIDFGNVKYSDTVLDTVVILNVGGDTGILTVTDISFSRDEKFSAELPFHTSKY